MLILNDNEIMRIDSAGNVSVDPVQSDPVPPPAPVVYTIDFSQLATRYAADSLHEAFTNAPGTHRYSNSMMTAPVHWIIPDDPLTTLALESKNVYRDIEVSAFGWTFTLLIRKSDAGAYFCYCADGNIQVGIVTAGIEKGNRPTQWGASNFGILWEGSIDKISSGKFGPDDHLSFGASGVNLYLKHNGQTLMQTREYELLGEGTVAVKCDPTYLSSTIGIDQFSMSVLPQVAILSTTEFIDPRDFGLKALPTNCDTAEGSDQITVSNPDGWKVGDRGIIEETRRYAEGMGVGGRWPELGFKDQATLQAFIPVLDGSYAVDESTGRIWRWGVNTGWTRFTKNHYLDLAIPKALQFRVVSIKDNIITMDKAARRSIKGARLDHDNSYILSKLTCSGRFDYFYSDVLSIAPRNLGAVRKGKTIKLPAGQYALWWSLFIQDRPGMKIVSEGNTTLYSPLGAPTASLVFYNSPNSYCGFITVQGNVGFRRGGLLWDHYHANYVPSIPGVNNYVDAQGWSFPDGGVVFMQYSDNSVGEYITVIDCFRRAVQASFGSNITLRYNKARFTEGVFDYVGWMFQLQDCQYGAMAFNEFSSPVMGWAMEAFKAHHITIQGNKITNGYFAFNNAGNSVLKNTVFRVTNNSFPANFNKAVGTEVISINTNIGTDFAVDGVSLEDNSLTVEAWPKPGTNDQPNAINVGDNNPKVTIRNFTHTHPDMKGTSGRTLLLTGKSATLDGFTIQGKTDAANGDSSNIVVYYGKDGGTSGTTVNNITCDKIKISRGVSYSKINATKLEII